MSMKSRRQVVGVFWIILGVIISLVTRLSHPEMTETQLLISYFPVWIVVGIFSVAGVVMVNEKRPQSISPSVSIGT